MKLNDSQPGQQHFGERISPHFGGGSGLKRVWEAVIIGISKISPHFGGGSGLKLIILSAMKKLRPNLPSLRWGERIETCRSERTARCCRCISPHFGGGSGLKLGACDQAIYGRELISPHFGGGSGLKLPKPRRSWIKRRGNLPSLRWGERIETQVQAASHSALHRQISPHFGGGSGLKLSLMR